jgi:hypothetical protein
MRKPKCDLGHVAIRIFFTLYKVKLCTSTLFFARYPTLRYPTLLYTTLRYSTLLYSTLSTLLIATLRSLRSLRYSTLLYALYDTLLYPIYATLRYSTLTLYRPSASSIFMDDTTFQGLRLYDFGHLPSFLIESRRRNMGRASVLYRDSFVHSMCI